MTLIYGCKYCYQPVMPGTSAFQHVHWPNCPDVPTEDPSLISAEELVLKYRRQLRQLLYECGVRSNPAVDDNWILLKLRQLLRHQLNKTEPVEVSKIDCPACGLDVRQMSSATLSLALWQHWRWACPVRPRDPHVQCLSPDYCGTGDADTLCPVCRQKAETHRPAVRRRITLDVEAKDPCALREALLDAVASLSEDPTMGVVGSDPPRWNYSAESTDLPKGREQ